MQDDTHSRTHAHHAAEAARAWLTLERPRTHHVDDVTRDLMWTERRATHARAALAGLPDLTALERALAQQSARLLPAELQRLQAIVHAPHRLIVPSVRRELHAILHDDHERER